MVTDENNNPAAFTTDIAHQAGLLLGKEYELGTSFISSGMTYHTAKLLGDPIQTTILVLDKIGFYTGRGGQRWDYIGLPKFIWESLSPDQKRDVIGFMYKYEGGTAMRSLFPNYGKL